MLLIPSRELGWTEVRNALANVHEISHVHTATSLSQATDLAASAPPDAVILGPPAGGHADIAKLAELRQILGPGPAIVMIAADFDVNLVFMLGHAGITGYLLWADLTTDSLSRCLVTAVVDGMMVGSRSVGRAAVEAAQQRVAPPVDPGILTEVEQTVLRRLSEGLTEPEIAAVEFVSERSVQRTITSAKQKLGAPNLFVLGMAFVRLPIASENDRLGQPEAPPTS